MSHLQYIANAIEREIGISFAHLMSANPIIEITTKEQRAEIFRIITEGKRNQANATDTTLTIVNLVNSWTILQNGENNNV